MAAAAKAPTIAPFELRSASLSAVALVLATSDLTLLAEAMTAQFGATPTLFDHDPVIVDLNHVPGEEDDIDFLALIDLLRRQRLLPVGVRGGSEARMAAALAAGLGEALTGGPVVAAPAVRPAEPTAPSARDLPQAAAAPPGTAAPAGAGQDADIPPMPAPDAAPATLTIDRPLRSGQQVYAKGGDLIVLAAVNFGAEVLADGNIHVYGPLRGKAVAGARGDASARIFSTCMEPELVAIAGTYRTTELPLPAEVVGKPAQIRLQGDRLVFEPLA